MSDSMNPYESPRTELQEQRAGESFGVVTEPMIASMKQSSSWIKFIAIYGYICAGITIVYGVVSAFSTSFISYSWWDPIFSVLIGFFIIITGIVIIVPLRFLYNFGSKMNSYVQTNNASSLELAFKNNKSFWKFCGILMIISLAFIPVSLIIMGILYV